MTTGVVLAWATEAQERGLVSERRPTACSSPGATARPMPRPSSGSSASPTSSTGTWPAAWSTRPRVRRRRTSPWPSAATRWPATTPAPAAISAILIGARHSHLDNAGYSVDQKVFVKGRPRPERTCRELAGRGALAAGALQPGRLLLRARHLSAGTGRTALQVAGVEPVRRGADGPRQGDPPEKYRFKIREGFRSTTFGSLSAFFPDFIDRTQLDESYLRLAASHESFGARLAPTIPVAQSLSPAFPIDLRIRKPGSADQRKARCSAEPHGFTAYGQPSRL